MALPVTGLLRVQFSGQGSTGPLSVPGVKAGDVLLWLYASTAFPSLNLAGNDYFEQVASVDDELRQDAAVTYSFDAILVRSA